QLASVLSHEWAHVELDHFAKLQQMIGKPAFFFSKSKLKKLSRKHEQQADDWANKRLRLHHFDPNQINHYLRRLQKTLKNSKRSAGHKKLKNRLQKHSIKPEIVDQIFIQMVQSL
ncbi:MAG: hypothetical protein L3J52_05610, partial [Proteobacteria bacterium]|nr:hypothetical protein [Pseudomonadota bacterium]